ncbi:MAG: DUF1993 domain-containing protein [Proteobacteria bacterium]|nr:DUF1993 domain-containing protein [Pseudomonadota bacterium]
MSLTSLLIPTYRHMLQTLAGLLDKACAQVSAEEAEALLSKRLAEDMYPLSSQIRFVCFQAQEATYRLRILPIPDTVMQIALEGRNAGEEPGSIADVRSRIQEALAFLDTLAPDALDAGVEETINLELQDGTLFDMTGEQYIRDWALPQAYFHMVTAYAILRNQKIEIGKADYVPHMFDYLRPATVS